MGNIEQQPQAVRVTSVACNHCGASLEVGLTTRFVTCAYCGSKLEVHRSGSSLYTEVLEAIDQRTQRMAEDLDAIKRQNEVERLDREWMLRRDQLLVQDKHGRTSVPSTAGSIIGSVVAGILGIIWTVSAASAGAPGFFVLFGLVFVVIAIGMGIAGAGKAAIYRDEERAYQRQRDQILSGSNDGPARENSPP